MLKVVRWYNGAPRAEINQRARDTCLRLERIARLLAPRAAVTDSWFTRALCLFSFGIYGEAWQGNRAKGALRNRRPSRMPKTQEEGIASVVI